ncbi:CHAD domain-containing protein [Flavobacterium sp. RSP29]|uniref:CHAD domain-containing protein n=1 Tax=Flavobacterium sp. RSP29 TaxID=3401731 RepID=UPI003AAA542D
MKALKTYFKKRKSATNLILEKSPKSYTPETFHSLRVDIKKINALFDLLNYCYKKFDHKKNYSSFKLIFKQTGRIRDLQIEQSLLAEQPNFHLLQAYSDHLKKLETKELKRFFAISIKSFVVKFKKKHRKIIPLLTKVGKKKVNRYMDKKRREIKKLMCTTKFKKTQIHTFRKRLKTYQYNEKILRCKSQNQSLGGKNILSDLLGEWHDYEVIINHLKKGIKSNETIPSETKELQVTKALLTSKIELLFDKINATLPYQTLL